MSTSTLDEISAKAQVSKDESCIRALIVKVLKARQDRDAAAIVAPYTEDAAVFNLAPPLAHQGVDLRETQAWLGSWETPIELETRDLRITVSGEFAFWHCLMRMRGTKKGAEGAVDFWMRETLCMERGSGSGGLCMSTRRRLFTW